MAEEKKKTKEPEEAVGAEEAVEAAEKEVESGAESSTEAATPQSGDEPSPEGKGDGKAAAAHQPESEPGKPAEPDWKNLYAVTLADFDNYKKRAARDREDVYRYAESDILKDVLPTVDNLALALANAPDGEDKFVKGVQLVYDGLLKSLADHGAKPMDDLVGAELDPNFHEAIATLPSADVAEGRISNVAKTGWTLNGKLLRAAQVVVSAGKPGEEKGKGE